MYGDILCTSTVPPRFQQETKIKKRSFQKNLGSKKKLGFQNKLSFFFLKDGFSKQTEFLFK